MKRLLFFLIILSSEVFSQQKDSIENYIDFLKHDEDVYCQMIYGSLHYQYITPGKISNSGNGAVVGFGVNLARFVSKKTHLAVFGTFKSRELLWPCNMNNTFSGLLTENSNFNNLNHSDSVMASYFTSIVGKKHSLGGSGRLLYGVSFYLPFKYFPLIKFYKGSVTELLDVAPEVKEITDDSDWIYFNYHTFGTELTVLYDYKNYDEPKSKRHYSVTLFCEKYSLKNAEINGVHLSSFLNDSFYRKYGNDWRFGIKLGIEFW